MNTHRILGAPATGRRRWAASVAAAAAALLLTVTQASAASTAYLNRTQWITDSPESSAITSQVRSIYLADGTYVWALSTSDASNGAHVDGSLASRRIYLQAGTYTWYCTISAEMPYTGRYVSQCSLRNGGNAPAIMQSGSWLPPYSGNYTWGGYLAPQ
ncbi:hypothetical protein [Streptomyces sp. t39]|uniref:hypothetical protein n=1 Tax=Streptomyces sp. t39 TaxID=1828156 RepID=UPI0011CD434E|nr:hypothetical protein [Streptomyces sp. t39]TXS52319.1 hypothetical protein EAO77_21285 [Streptomyces sp. t39]